MSRLARPNVSVGLRFVLVLAGVALLLLLV